ncbi:MAG TPA: fluoride efflux transporter CrcB [Caulobacteraceae bacterium]|jgi:CrcB protein|nr:fluoride efflux transporter CrcB [Caulobacteraceae bacterium]
MINLLLVGVGGATGAMARYLTGVGYGRLFGPGQPYLATAFINVLGSLLMGVLVGVLALKVSEAGMRWRLLLAVGVLGGFTTFSSFSLEAVLMLERRAYGAMAAYILGSVVFSILGLMLGLLAVRKVFS